MSGDYDYSTAGYAAAIAAAAFAVQSLDNKGEVVSKSSLKLSEESLPKSSLRDRRIPEKAPSIKKKVSFEDITGKPEKPAPGDKDKDLDMTDRKKPETSLPMPKHPPREPFMTQPVQNRTKKAIKLGPGDTRADAWEKAEMVSIKERYEKMMANIENWRTKKNTRAIRKIERIEAELDRRRVKAMQSYRDSITRIEGIARGTKAQAEETRRNEEFKVKEKANKIRSTGKLPATCLCF